MLNQRIYVDILYWNFLLVGWYMTSNIRFSYNN